MSTTCTHLAPRSRRGGERQRLWDTVAAQFIILNRLFAQIAGTEAGAELRSDPGLRSGPRMQGRLRPRVRKDLDHVRGRINDRENFCPRLGLSSNGGGMSADICYRSAAGIVRAIAAGVADDELQDRQSAAPAIGLDRLEQDLESFRARYRTADLHPHIVIDDFLVPAATERAVRAFSVLHSQQWNNSYTPTSGSSPTRNRRRSGAPRSNRVRPSPIRRGSPAP